MGKLVKFGEEVEGYSIPVLNEREIRAAAGILFLATFISLMLIMFEGNFVPVKFVIIFFFDQPYDLNFPYGEVAFFTELFFACLFT